MGKDLLAHPHVDLVEQLSSLRPATAVRLLIFYLRASQGPLFSRLSTLLQDTRLFGKLPRDVLREGWAYTHHPACDAGTHVEEPVALHVAART